MGIALSELVSYCNQLLNIQAFEDYCPNGLQVEACQQVNKIVTGVTASEALIDAAIELNADVLMVHHGYFWRGESPALTGIKARRIQKLMNNGISLIAYHLPLDAHPVLGNNVQLAKKLHLIAERGLDNSANPIGLIGRLNHPMAVDVFAKQITQSLQRPCLTIANDDRKLLTTVAWCTGAAQSYIEKAAAAGVDCFISGEISEQTVHLARELGIAYFACGHHATERYGIKALGEHITSERRVDCQFVDIDNPV